MVKLATSVLAASLLVAPVLAQYQYDSEVSSRELAGFDELYGRDFADYLELDARDPFFRHVKNFVHRLRHGHGGHHHHGMGGGMSGSMGQPAPVDAQPQPQPDASQQPPSRRDLLDLEFYTREFDDDFELDARDPLFHHIKNFIHRMRHGRQGGEHHHHHHGMGGGMGGSGMGGGMGQPAPVDAQPQPDASQQPPSRRDLEDLEFYTREFDDDFELEAREPVFHHIKKFIHRLRHGRGGEHHHHHGMAGGMGGGMAQSAPVDAQAQPQPDASQQPPSRRELFDDDFFFAREDFDDLD